MSGKFFPQKPDAYPTIELRTPNYLDKEEKIVR